MIHVYICKYVDLNKPILNVSRSKYDNQEADYFKRKKKFANKKIKFLERAHVLRLWIQYNSPEASKRNAINQNKKNSCIAMYEI